MPSPTAECRGGGASDLLARNVTHVLGQVPPVAEGIGELPLQVAPELIREWMEDLGARIDGLPPERCDVVREQMEDDRRAPDALRGQDPGFGELVGNPDCRVAEPQLHVEQLSAWQFDPVVFLRTQGGWIPLGGPDGVSNDDVGCDTVHPLGDRPDVYVHVGLLVVSSFTRCREPGQRAFATRSIKDPMNRTIRRAWTRSGSRSGL